MQYFGELPNSDTAGDQVIVSDYTNYRITQTKFKLGFTAGGIHQCQITQIIRLCDIRLRDPDCSRFSL